jgi:hypothetical protein
LTSQLKHVVADHILLLLLRVWTMKKVLGKWVHEHGVFQIEKIIHMINKRHTHQKDWTICSML